MFLNRNNLAIMGQKNIISNNDVKTDYKFPIQGENSEFHQITPMTDQLITRKIDNRQHDITNLMHLKVKLDKLVVNDQEKKFINIDQTDFKIQPRF